MHYRLTPTNIKKSEHNKHMPDITITKEGIEYDMSLAPIKAYYLSERLAEKKDKHETLKQYDIELEHDANYRTKQIPNIPLQHARTVKIQRHRDLLPQLLF